MVTAIFFALLAVLPTALTVFTATGPAVSIDDVERVVPATGEAVVVVLVTLLLTALVSGWLGGLVGRRFRVTGAALALVLAWLLGALLLPIVSALLGIEFRMAVVCFDTCAAALDSSQPASALLLVLVGMTATALTIVGAIVPLVLVVVAIVLARRRHPTAAIVCFAIAFGVLNLLAFALVEGAFVPYLCLWVGVAAWSRWLDARAVVATEAPVEAEQPAVA